eukprot:785352-Amphidinium_carterae.1
MGQIFANETRQVGFMNNLLCVALTDLQFPQIITTKTGSIFFLPPAKWANNSNQHHTAKSQQQTIARSSVQCTLDDLAVEDRLGFCQHQQPRNCPTRRKAASHWVPLVPSSLEKVFGDQQGNALFGTRCS